MKIILRAALIAVSSLTLFALGAQATTIGTPTDNDAILGFFSPSSGYNLEFDLGPMSQFLNATAPIVLSEVDQQDLVNTYGINFASSSQLTWGIIATNGRFNASLNPTGNSTIYATEPVTDPASAPYPIRSTGQNALSISDIEPVATLLGSQTVNAINPVSGTAIISPVAAVLQYTHTGDGTYWGQDTFSPGVSFRQFQPLIDNPVTNTLTTVNGQPASVSDFLQLTPGSGTTGKLLGQFELVADTTFEFVPVPEPSSLGLIGVGFLSLIGMVLLRRRRSMVVA